MQGFENHLRTAATQFSNGDLKEAYLSYLFAAQSLLSKLSTEVVFEDKSRISSQPEYIQSLFSISTKCLRSAEDIVRNRCVYSPSTHPLIEEEEKDGDITDTPISASPNIVTVEATLPLIPLSPLTQMSIIHSSSLASASQKLTLAKRSKTPVGLPTLRRLTEDVRIQRGKLDSINKQIKSVADVVISSWNPDALAKQLTIIEAQLFSKLSIKGDFLSAKPRTTKIQGCLDFHRYITNSITHQIIAGSEVSNSATREHPRDYIIAHVIRAAYLLLHVYRNFSGFAAIIKALTSPEVRRLRKSWKKVPSKTKEMLKDLSRHIKEENKFRSYHDALSYKLGETKEFGPGLVAIPWIERHLEKLEAVLKSYSTGRKSDANKFDPSVYLSEPGARKLETILFTLEQCQGNPSEDQFTVERQKTPRRRTFMEIDGAKSQIALPSNLLDIGGTDLALHHWLVSRVYLTRYQLWEESLEYESPAFGELVPTFVKENGQTLIESHHMGHHTDTPHFEDVGQFNDYFPSEGDHPPMDLDRMESVDEFLSFLDQDLIESSTPNTVLPSAKDYQYNNPWDEGDHTPSPTIAQTPNSHQPSVERVFEETSPIMSGSAADSEILRRFKSDLPGHRNGILFNSVKPSSAFNNVFGDDYDSSCNSSPLPSNRRSIFIPDVDPLTKDSNEIAAAASIPTNGVQADSQQSPSGSLSEHSDSQHSDAEEDQSNVEVESGDHKLLDTGDTQEFLSTLYFSTVDMNHENNDLDESSALESMHGNREVPAIQPSKGDNDPISPNGVDEHHHPSDTPESEQLESLGELNEPISTEKTIEDINELNATPPSRQLDTEQDIYTAVESEVNEDVSFDEGDTKQEISNAQDETLEFIKDSSYDPVDAPQELDRTSELNVDPLTSSLPDTPFSQKEAALVVPDFQEDGDNSSEEEPRKFLSLEKLIRLNELDYVEEKSDGDTSITISDDEAGTDTKQATEYKQDYRKPNGRTGPDYNSDDSIKMNNSDHNDNPDS
ncbi:hypothetical protein K7432_001393 [Basidiobolus ranarum]|uniref:Ras-GEF domain-containing protein n=1 Tax=Basidiobolus ranarum TaxID=34480 RepID=A0ABR2W9P3_9FUNG